MYLLASKVAQRRQELGLRACVAYLEATIFTIKDHYIYAKTQMRPAQPYGYETKRHPTRRTKTTPSEPLACSL
jgi:hypothetical protein